MSLLKLSYIASTAISSFLNANEQAGTSIDSLPPVPSQVGIALVGNAPPMEAYQGNSQLAELAEACRLAVQAQVSQEAMAAKAAQQTQLAQRAYSACLARAHAEARAAEAVREAENGQERQEAEAAAAAKEASDALAEFTAHRAQCPRELRKYVNLTGQDLILWAVF